MTKTLVITGAGGFIGGHVARSKQTGAYDRLILVDKKPLREWWQLPDRDCIVVDGPNGDLRDPHACEYLLHGEPGADVIHLAADMGGIGFIESHKLDCMLNVQLQLNVLRAARRVAGRVLYSSSACVYSRHRQLLPDHCKLTESMAYPAMPEDGYGWEKLFSERLCKHYADAGLDVRVVRLHNVYGPHGAWQDGREKAPAALCRKVAERLDPFPLWGDGRQVRSFLYIDDCIEGLWRLLNTTKLDATPCNLGSEELVTIRGLLDAVCEAAGWRPALLERFYGEATGVPARCSDNDLLRRITGWEPRTRLAEGIAKTYEWVASQVAIRGNNAG